jgi:hypothetical protein
MSEPVQVNVTTVKEKPSRWQRLKGAIRGTPPHTLEESNRFSRLGYLQYPKRQQLDSRLFQLEEILREIEDELDTTTPDATTFKHIKKLVTAFMTVGAPWFRGLDDRELAKKAVTFYKLESIIGESLSAFYPDLKRCVQVLINLSWQALDVVAETPVLFETRTTVTPQGGIDLSGSSTDREHGKHEEV